jgi:nicotinamidase-related amidase
MHRNYVLDQKNTGLLVVDVQERLMNQVENACEVIYRMRQIIKGFQIFKMPIVVTEQYPQGLGKTTMALRECFGDIQHYFSKTTFSCLDDQVIRQHISSLPIDSWVVVGIEAHICVLQTAKSLLALGKQVVVVNDAITSRSIYDFSTGIAEMRDIGVRISSVETVLFEMLRSSEAPEFKAISELIKG